jgi:hypothetical protein
MFKLWLGQSLERNPLKKITQFSPSHSLGGLGTRQVASFGQRRAPDTIFSSRHRHKGHGAGGGVEMCSLYM